MESTNKPSVKRWFSIGGKPPPKGKTVVEYLPDADEIERSPVPPFAQITLRVLIVLFVTFFAWAAISQIDLVVVSRGKLVNPLPNVVVQPLETSIVQSVDVRSGQIVKKGDKLATMDATFAQADESQLRNRLSSLETQVQGMELELQGGISDSKVGQNEDEKLQADLLAERRANYRAQRIKLGETSAKLRAALDTNRSDQRRIEARLRSLKEIEGMQEKMVAQKFGAPIQLLEAQQRTKEVERDLELAGNREQELRRELAAFEAEKMAFEKGWRQRLLEELLNVTRERDSVKEQLQKADRRYKLIELVAPIDAVVLEVAKLSPGSVVQGGQTFFTLVPLNVDLAAEIKIDSADVGYITVGDSVQIKLDSFPFQKHGTLDAKIVSISQDAFKPEGDVRSVSDAYYLARVSLTSTTLKNMLESARLLPGMTLSAEIVVGKRSVMSYLAWPLTKGLTESIREP